MTDNVQPIHGTQASSLPDVDPTPSDPVARNATATNAGGSPSDLPETPAQNPMPAWFMGLVVLIVLIMAGGGYVGYLVLTNQLSVPGTQATPLKAPVAPPVPQSADVSKTAVTIGDQSDALQSVAGGAPQYQINIMQPTRSAPVTVPAQGTPRVMAEVELNPPANLSPSAVNVEATPFIPHSVNHEATSPSSMLELNTHEVLAEHSERLLALEGLAAEHGEVLALMKDELQSTKRRLIATDKNITKVIKRIDGLTGKAVKAPRARTPSNVAVGSLPFKPLSYRTFGEQVSVRVRAPSQKAQSLRVGQALSGWRLMSADPVARTAVFLNVSSFKKHEVAL